MLKTGQTDEETMERTRKYTNLHRYIAKSWDEATLIEALKAGWEETDG